MGFTFCAPAYTLCGCSRVVSPQEMHAFCCYGAFVGQNVWLSDNSSSGSRFPAVISEYAPCTCEGGHYSGRWFVQITAPDPSLHCRPKVRAAQHLLSEKGSILDVPREMSACMAEGRYTDLVKLYRKAQATYSSSILGQVRASMLLFSNRNAQPLLRVPYTEIVMCYMIDLHLLLVHPSFSGSERG